MPLLYQQNINGNTKLAVWHITESEDFFLVNVKLQKNITHPHKRLQHLAGRYLLRELFPDFPLELVRIAGTKKPFLEDEAYHFSVSHCGDYAAVIISPENRVGVDIELVSDKAGRLKDKFLNSNEQQIFKFFSERQPLIQSAQLFTYAWSIKETIFKWQGSNAIDFREHMHIEKIKIASKKFIAACLFKKNTSIKLTVNGLLLHNILITWLVT